MFDLLANVMSAPLLVPMDINIDPNTNGLPGINRLRTIVGAVMTIGLILSVLALIVSAIVWGFGANSSNPHLASRGKIGVLVDAIPPSVPKREQDRTTAELDQVTRRTDAHFGD